MQLIDSMSVCWKRNITNDKGNSRNLCIFCIYQIYVINRLNYIELYAMQIYCGNSKPILQIYIFQNNFSLGRNMYVPQKVTVDTFTRMFQYQIIDLNSFTSK